MCSCAAAFAGCRLPSEPLTICSAPPCPFENCACSSLGAQQCGPTTGCIAATCKDCNGQAQFVACLSPGQMPPQCPTGVCPITSCRKDTDCSNIGFCLPPGKTPCSDGHPPSCTADSACSNGTVCASTTCYGKVCVAPCTPTSCEIGQGCVNQRCVPQPCAGSCPSHFACVAGACQRESCAGDGDCKGGGACVDGQCWDAAGICTRPAG